MRPLPSAGGLGREGVPGIGAGGVAGSSKWKRGERKERIVGDTSRSSFDNIHVLAATGVHGRTKIENTSGMGSPRGTCERGFKHIAQFPGRANGMGIKIERKTMKAVVGRECGIRVPWLEVV
jgi:hypothetical protein